MSFVRPSSYTPDAKKSSALDGSHAHNHHRRGSSPTAEVVVVATPAAMPRQRPVVATVPKRGGGGEDDRVSMDVIRAAKHTMGEWLAQRSAKVDAGLERMRTLDRKLDEDMQTMKRRSRIGGEHGGGGGATFALDHHLPTPVRGGPTEDMDDGNSDLIARVDSELQKARSAGAPHSAPQTTPPPRGVLNGDRTRTVGGLEGDGERHRPPILITSPLLPQRTTHPVEEEVSFQNVETANILSSAKQPKGYGRAVNPSTGAPIGIDEVARRRRVPGPPASGVVSGSTIMASANNNNRNSGHHSDALSDPARVILGVFAPLGLVPAALPSTPTTTTATPTMLLVSKLEDWLINQRGGTAAAMTPLPDTVRTSRRKSDTAPFTARGQQQQQHQSLGDSELLVQLLWHTLHRTVFYCVRVLTPAGDADDGPRRRPAGPLLIPVPLASRHGNADDEHRQSPTGARKGARKQLSNHPAASPRGDCSSELTPRSWLFIALSLMEMGYPRHEILCFHPPPPTRSTASTNETSSYADDVREERRQRHYDCDYLVDTIHELLLALLWMARRYQLPAVAELVELRRDSPFLFEHDEEGEELDGKKEDHRQQQRLMRFPVGDGWVPWCTADSNWLDECCALRRAFVAKHLQRCEAALVAATRMPASGEKPRGGGGPHDAAAVDHRRAAWLASRYVLQMQMQAQRHMTHVEALLRRRADLSDALGSAHSAQDLVLCLPSNAALYDEAVRGLRRWAEMPRRCRELRDSMLGFMNILVSIQRTGSVEGNNDALDAAIAEDASLLSLARGSGSMKMNLGQPNRVGDASRDGRRAPSTPKLVSRDDRERIAPKCDDVQQRQPLEEETQSYQLEDHLSDSEEDSGVVHNGGVCSQLPFSRRRRATPAAAAAAGVVGGVDESCFRSAPLCEVIERYRRTSAFEFFDSKRIGYSSKWKKNMTLDGSPSRPPRNRPPTEGHEEAPVCDAVLSSVRQRYALGPCVAAELRVLELGQQRSPRPRADRKSHRKMVQRKSSRMSSSPSSRSSSSSSTEGQIEAIVVDEPPLHPSKNYSVLAECKGLELSAKASASIQPVLVGPPAAGRTTSARVEIHRLQQLLDQLVDSLPTAAHQPLPQGVRVVPRAKR